MSNTLASTTHKSVSFVWMDRRLTYTQACIIHRRALQEHGIHSIWQQASCSSWLNNCLPGVGIIHHSSEGACSAELGKSGLTGLSHSVLCGLQQQSTYHLVAIPAYTPHSLCQF